MAQKDKYVSEADLAMTIKQRVAAEKAKWEAQHKRELDELRRELKKKQGQERKPVAVVEEHSDEDSDVSCMVWVSFVHVCWVGQEAL